MIKPIYIYGHPILRKKSRDITQDYPKLEGLIEDMYETMKCSQGIGLAAPQIGHSIRLFIADTSLLAEEDSSCENYTQVFINPKIHSYFGENKPLSEGCLSIPEIRENINRKSEIRISYYDRDFAFKENVRYNGWIARIIQHEYDHLDGILFTDRLPPLRRQLLKNKLKAIARGKFKHTYKFILAK